MMGRLHVDLFFQDRFLLNCVSVKIRLVRSKDAFSLTAGGQNPDYNVQVVDAVLFASKAVLSPTVQMAHIKALEKGTTKYPIRPVDCKVYSIPQGAMSHTHDNLFFGTLPKRLILWCIDNDAYNGEYSKNRSTPNTTPLTSWPSTLTDVRFLRNRSSQTLRLAATFEATSTCFPPPVNNQRTKGTDCRAMTLVKATPSSASI